MTYVLSDLHGDYKSYKKMLKRISFSDNDTLYVIGDICDRGPRSVEIYMDVMSRNNVVAIKGNHELMAESVLPYLFKFRKPKSKAAYKDDYMIWLDNGGDCTIKSLSEHNKEVIYDVIEFIGRMPYHKTVKVGDKEFVLIHAGFDRYIEGMPLDKYDPFLLVWTRPDYDTRLWSDENKYLIVGHTPTMFINRDSSSRIYHGSGNVIAIDCGNAYRVYGGMLGCLCLDTMEEFYV